MEKSGGCINMGIDYEIIYQIGDFIILVDDESIIILNMETMQKEKYNFNIYGLSSEYIDYKVKQLADDFTYQDFLKSEFYAKIKEMEEKE